MAFTVTFLTDLTGRSLVLVDELFWYATKHVQSADYEARCLVSWFGQPQRPGWFELCSAISRFLMTPPLSVSELFDRSRLRAREAHSTFDLQLVGDKINGGIQDVSSSK